MLELKNIKNYIFKNLKYSIITQKYKKVKIIQKSYKEASNDKFRMQKMVEIENIKSDIL